MTSSINSMKSPLNWELDGNQTLLNSQEILKLSKTLQFLEKNPNWMQQHAHEQLAKDIANKAFTTKVPPYLKQQMDRLKSALANIPGLVPEPVSEVTIKMGSKEERILRNTLISKSELFKSGYLHTDQGKGEVIELNTQGVSDAAIQHFLKFLKDGNIDFGDDVYDLYHLAASYNVIELQKHIEAYIEENLNEESLVDVYEFATALNSENVQNACFRFVLKNSNLSNKIKSSHKEADINLRVFLNTVENWRKNIFQKCKDLGIEISIEYKSEKLMVTDLLKKLKEVSEKMIIYESQEESDTTELQEETEISELKKEIEILESIMLVIFKNYGTGTPAEKVSDMLKKIEKELQDAEKLEWQPNEDVKMLLDQEELAMFELEIIEISGQINEKIINLIKKSVSQNGINIRLSHDLTHDMLDVIKEIQSKAEIFELRLDSMNEADLQKLLEIKVNPRKLFITKSSIQEVPQIWQQSVELLGCKMCNELMALKVSNANKVLVENCPNLKSLEAPNATFVSVSVCDELTVLNVSKAIEVNISECESLTSLEAPDAETVNARDCSLQSVNLPKAMFVDCYGNRDLMNLSVPNASFVNYRNCKKLVHLKIKEDIDPGNRPHDSLETLDVLKDSQVWVSGYPNLKKLNVATATEVKVGRCGNLTNLEASKATFVKIFDCKSLDHIVAPNATIEFTNELI